ncbi:MAG: CBS domain-containing protein, partial [Chloroflexi bacterium]|nr:CBS domain-containing protein [Chloroflexota bacterium]
MKIITSHERTDMDAFASLYAASLLYPDYEPVLPSKLNRNVRDLAALFKDELPMLTRRKLTHRRITHMLLVDTQGIAPLRGVDETTLVHIIDHHPLEHELPSTATYEGGAVGATTTLLTERIREQGLPLSRVGASLMLMGIYEDTGSLSYLTTTPRDASAAAWLLAQGADVALVGEFLSRPLTDQQRSVLSRLVASTAVETIRARTIALAGIVLDQYVDELSALIHQLMDTFEPDACFLLAQFEDDVQIIARSGTDAIDVASLLRPFGGGGHSKAAAALVEHDDLTAVQQRLRDALQEQIVPPVSVRKIMSTNVHTLRADMLVRDAAQLMRRYGHEGFPVLDGERLVGILTRRDIDRALHHHLGELPVRNYIYTGAVFVHPDDPVSRVQQVMLEHDLGQVPVVLGGRFVGIVTRTDLIKLWTPSLYPPRAGLVRRMMDETLPAPLASLLQRARDTANDMGFSLYIVGGFVRDLLLGAPTLDLDLVVEGDAIRMAHHLAVELNGRVISHARFGTAKVLLPAPREQGIPASLDFVTARTEFYERPSVLPEV